MRAWLSENFTRNVLDSAENLIHYKPKRQRKPTMILIKFR